MAFDFDSAMAGAQTGSVAGPYGAIAGFAVGGFIGGQKNKKIKKLQKKREKRLRYLTSPKHFADVTRELTPLFREQVAGGAGAEATAAINSRVARGGLTGTGIGTALSAGAAAIPEVMAFKEALGQSGDIIANQLTHYGVDIPKNNYAQQIGQIGDAVSLFKQLSAGNDGPEGGLTRLAPGEFDEREAEANRNATEDFGSQDFDFGSFRYKKG
jgi:hypothetical protein